VGFGQHVPPFTDTFNPCGRALQVAMNRNSWQGPTSASSEYAKRAGEDSERHTERDVARRSSTLVGNT